MPRLIKPPLIVYQTREFLSGLTELVHNKSQNALIHHVAHSKGGLTTIAAIEIMRPEEKALIHQKMLYTGFAPAMAAPKDYFLDTDNMYSQSDKVTKKFGICNRNRPGYHISIVPCLLPLDQLHWVKGDHDFVSPTYLINGNKRINRIERNFENYKFTSR